MQTYKYATMNFRYIKTFDDYNIRCGIFPISETKSKGLVILLSGRTEFMEKYFEVIYELNQRNFDVYSLDWRGQGLSSRILPDRAKGYIDSYETYIKDLYKFFKEIVEPDMKKPVIVLAHSMGAHIALRFLHDYPEIFHQAVFTAPMFDIETFPFPKILAKAIAWLYIKLGKSNDYVFGEKRYSAFKYKFEGNLLTSDKNRFFNTSQLIEKNPDLDLGGVTYSWLSASFESIDLINYFEYTKKIKTPILIVNAGLDKIVSEKAQRAISDTLPFSNFISIKDSLHEILQENDSIKSIFWDEFDKFYCFK